MHHPPQTKQQHLRDLVYEKNLWDEPLSEADKTKGFLGWHERGYLPHCDKPGLVQLVTFRLADSMPITKRGEWEHLLKIEDNKEKRNQLEAYLDRGDGECYLRNPRIAQITENALIHFHNKQYELLAWCVMPNHVHVLVHIWEKPLYKIIQSWKRYSATKALQALRLERRFLNRRDHTDLQTHEPNQNSALQSFWQREYWDTFMRDKDQERTAIRYIENNPTKSKLSRLPEDWPFSSARFRDDYAQLKLPLLNRPAYPFTCLPPLPSNRKPAYSSACPLLAPVNTFCSASPSCPSVLSSLMRSLSPNASKSAAISGSPLSVRKAKATTALPPS